MAQDFLFRVDDAYNKDQLRGMARIDGQFMRDLGISDGDIVQIRGKKEALATCHPLHEQDKGRNAIRIERVIQHNAGLKVGDMVSIKKVTAAAARETTLEPMQNPSPVDPRYITDLLNEVPLMKGDECVVPYFSGHLSFLVAETIPAGNVIVKNEYTSCIFTKDPPSSSNDPSLDMQIRNVIQDLLKIKTMTDDELEGVIEKIRKIYDKSHADAFRYPRKNQ